jgi:hypothetical protein
MQWHLWRLFTHYCCMANGLDLESMTSMHFFKFLKDSGILPSTVTSAPGRINKRDIDAILAQATAVSRQSGSLSSPPRRLQQQQQQQQQSQQQQQQQGGGANGLSQQQQQHQQHHVSSSSLAPSQASSHRLSDHTFGRYRITFDVFLGALLRIAMRMRQLQQEKERGLHLLFLPAVAPLDLASSASASASSNAKNQVFAGQNEWR